jgi:hypothetical protein
MVKENTLLGYLPLLYEKEWIVVRVPMFFDESNDDLSLNDENRPPKLKRPNETFILDPVKTKWAVRQIKNHEATYQLPWDEYVSIHAKPYLTRKEDKWNLIERNLAIEKKPPS